MTAPRSMETRRLLERATWEWQPVEPILVEASKLIQPGKAIRRYDSNAASRIARRTPTNPRPVTEEEKISYGRRSIIRDAVRTTKDVLEYTRVDGVELYRRRERRDVISDQHLATLLADLDEHFQLERRMGREIEYLRIAELLKKKVLRPGS